MNPLRRIPLFKRFPTFHVALREDDLVKPEERDNYPAFAEDFKTLDEELMRTFRDFDNEALRNQNFYRGMYVILILGVHLLPSWASFKLRSLILHGLGLLDLL